MRMTGIRKWAGTVTVVCAFAAGSLVGLLSATRLGRWVPAAAPFYAANERTPAGSQVSFAAGFAPLVSRALPAVVNVSSSRIVHSSETDRSFPFPSFFQDLSSSNPSTSGEPHERREEGLGSGVIVKPDGYLLTTYHVIDGATSVEVALADKRRFKARIIGTDSKSDIALLKIEGKNLPAVTLGNSSRVRVGDFALAIGNPFGVGQTVTMGIIGATGRGGLDPDQYEDFIQTDAAINPGNSGGALIDVQGELVGINTAIMTGGGMGNQGVGFAVPINMARDVMDQILRNGKVTRGWLGVAVQEVTPAHAKIFGLREPRGALIGDVTAGSSGAAAGLARGDIITALNGVPVTDSRTLRLQISHSRPGTIVRFRVFREGREREVSARLSDFPTESDRSQNKQAAAKDDRAKGTLLDDVAVDELKPEAARQLRVPAGISGILVVQIRAASPAAEAGLIRGDVVQEVNRKPVSSVSDFRRVLQESSQANVLLLVNRRGTTSFVALPGS